MPALRISDIGLNGEVEEFPCGKCGVTSDESVEGPEDDNGVDGFFYRMSGAMRRAVGVCKRGEREI